jgi:pilin isopeptide linkage protein
MRKYLEAHNHSTSNGGINMKIKRIAASVSAAALLSTAVMGTSITANAEYSVAGGSVTFASYITMDKEANVPNETFAYMIAPYGTNASEKASGTPTVGTAVFAAGQTTYTELQTMSTAITSKNQSTAGTTDKDAVTLTAGKKYARTEVTADFSAVTFKDIGTFQYVLQETPGTEPSITYDQKPTIMEVIVAYETDTSGAVIMNNGVANLTVKAYVMYQASSEIVNGKTVYTIDTATKADGFTNDYDTENLTIAKSVAGNQASHDEYFQFDVTISGAKEGTIYNVDLTTNAQAQTEINGASTVIHVNPSEMTADAYGAVTKTFWIHHGQSIVIQGLAKGTGYSVNENKTTIDSEGYTAAAAVTGDKANGGLNTLVSGTYTNTTGTLTNTITLNTDKTATFAAADTAAPANNATVTGTWAQNGYGITITAGNGDTGTIAYAMSSDGKTLTEIGTPTIVKLASMFTSSAASTNAAMDGTAVDIAMDENTLTVADTKIIDDTTVTFTNTKQGTIPTGVITNTAPYAVVVLAGFAGLVFFLKKKKNEEEYDG